MTQSIVLAILNSDWFWGIVIGLAVKWCVSAWQTSTGAKFKAYEGLAITAVKAAEKAIPDGTANKALAKMDYALKLFVEKYTKATGVAPSEADLAKIENVISIVHSSLEDKGTL